MTDNELLQQISDDLAIIKIEELGQYGSVVSVSGTATSSTAVTRAANSSAVKTVVTNTGPGTARVSEGGSLVKILDVYESWVSQNKGALAISVIATQGETAAVTISTYLT
jgi:hypothetical protein